MSLPNPLAEHAEREADTAYQRCRRAFWEWVLWLMTCDFDEFVSTCEKATKRIQKIEQERNKTRGQA